jgi:hypothetical protein
MNAIIPAGNTALTPTSMESAIQLAEMMARGKLVPSHLHNSPGDCLMVIEASMRWQMSLFAVAQCTSVIQGKLMFEGKLVAAALNASGILSSRLDYDFSGKDAQRAVTVRGTLKGETKAREVTVFLADAKTSNGMWTKQPDQQLVYAGTRVWARRHAPEVMLGVYAPEEFDQAAPFAGPTLEHDAREAINVEVPIRAAAAATPRAPRVTEKTAALYEAPAKPAPERTDEQWRVWIDKLKDAVDVLYRREEVVEIGERASVGDALANGPAWVQREISAILATAYKSFPDGTEPDLSDEALGEVEILGAEKVAAG